MTTRPSLLEPTPEGLYCAAGDFHVDPWRPVSRAVVTHGHADHAVPGSACYFGARAGADVLRVRLGAEASIELSDWGQKRDVNGVRISLHPAGHLLGSAQVRLEHRGERWVVSGDYATLPNPTCRPFEPVPCDTFVSECTFGLPVYRWPAPEQVFAELHAWWDENRAAGRASVLFTYALGKAQRILAGLDPARGPILVHGAVRTLRPAYEAAGVRLPVTIHATPEMIRTHRTRAFVLAPPSTAGSRWLRRFGEISTGFASGWMRIRGIRRRRHVDRGFVLSDHADDPGLMAAIEATGAERVIVTHGQTAAMARRLAERGRETAVFPTRYADTMEAEDHDAASSAAEDGEAAAREDPPAS